MGGAVLSSAGHGLLGALPRLQWWKDRTVQHSVLQVTNRWCIVRCGIARTVPCSSSSTRRLGPLRSGMPAAPPSNAPSAATQAAHCVPGVAKLDRAHLSGLAGNLLAQPLARAGHAGAGGRARHAGAACCAGGAQACREDGGISRVSGGHFKAASRLSGSCSGARAAAHAQLAGRKVGSQRRAGGGGHPAAAHAPPSLPCLGRHPAPLLRVCSRPDLPHRSSGGSPPPCDRSSPGSRSWLWLCACAGWDYRTRRDGCSAPASRRPASFSAPMRWPPARRGNSAWQVRRS